MNFGILDTVVVVLTIALVVTVVFRYLKLPVILGYLVVGAIVGPHGFDWIPDQKDIKDLAEFGVVFLMFTVGLEFSFSKIRAMKGPVFLLGGLQVLLSLVITTGVGIWVGMAPLGALIVGGIVAMSSTAIVVKQLSDQVELQERHGRNSIAILLFQDLAVIPFLILIASFADASYKALPTLLSIALIKGIVAIIVILAVGYWLLRPVFRMIAKTRVVELFTLAVLLVTLAAAWLTHALGLSYALGAFLAGIMLGETEFRHQIEIEIRPFRDVLLGLFFITIGMLVNVSTWQQTWEWIALLIVALIFGKALLIAAITRLARNSNFVSIRTGLTLAQGGEFGVAILTLALAHNLLPADYGQVVLAALILSFAVAPIFINYSGEIAAKILHRVPQKVPEQVTNVVHELVDHLDHHIIICGYGRVGQNLAHFLQLKEIPYLGLDIDPVRVQAAALAGHNVTYGDAKHPELLMAAGLLRAKAIVIGVDKMAASVKILDSIRHRDNHIPVLVRCKDEAEMLQLHSHGATQIVTEIYEESISLAHYLLELLKLPENEVSKLAHLAREKHYNFLRHIVPDVITGLTEEPLAERIRSFIVEDGAFAVDKKLEDLTLESCGVEVISITPAIIRNGDGETKRPVAIATTSDYTAMLQPGDIITLFGNEQQLDKAERQVLVGE